MLRFLPYLVSLCGGIGCLFLCQQLAEKKPQAQLPATPVIVVKNEAGLIRIPFHSMDRPAFNVIYLGKKRKKIAFSSGFHVSPYYTLAMADSADLSWKEVPSTHPYSLPDFTDIHYRSSRNGSVRLTVLTEGIPGVAKRYKGILPLVLENTGTDTLIVGANDMLDLEYQRWKNGRWETYYGPLFFGCGNGVYDFYLPPGEIAVALGCFAGNELRRVKIGKNVSNTFR